MELGILRESWSMESTVALGAGAHSAVAHALQLLAAADGGVTWLPEQRAIATSPLHGARPVRVAFCAEELTLLVLDDNGSALADLALEGRSGSEVAAWLREQLEASGVDAVALDACVPSGERPFDSADSDAHFEIARSYGNACCAMRCALNQLGQEAPLRISQNGAQLEAIVELSGGAGSVTLAFGPANARCTEPHYAVQPHPAPPPPEELPELEGGGHWITGEWLGAILGRSEWTFYDAEQLQTDCTVSFLESAVEECAALLGTSL